MPSSLFKTRRDKRLWEKAKGIAEEAGHKENWAYVMGVYKKMNPKRFDKAAGRWEAYTVTLEAPEGADEFDQVESTLHTYNLVDRTPFDDGVDYLVEVEPRYVSDFLHDMELLERNVRPYKFEVREGEHGPKVRLASTGPSAERVAALHVAYDEKGRDPEEGWQHGQVEPFQRTDGEGSQTPPAHDNQGKPLAVPDLGTLEIPGYEWHDKSKSFHQVVTKTARTYLRSPSSPKDAEPLTDREADAAWDAGYEAVTRVAGDRTVVDADAVWIWVANRDRRIPRGMVEGHPQFWEWHWAVIEGAYAGAKDYHIVMTGVPAQIRTASSLEMLGVDVRSLEARKQSWWSDLVKLVEEYWSLQTPTITLGRGVLKFQVRQNGVLNVEVRGPLEAPTVYANGASKKFNATSSLWEMIMWIDGVSRGMRA